MKIQMQVEIEVDDTLTWDDVEDIAQLEDFDDPRINSVSILGWSSEKPLPRFE